MMPYDYNNYYIKHHEDNTAATSCDALEPAKTEVAHIYQEICKNTTKRKVQLNDGSNNNLLCSDVNNEREENNAITIVRSNNETMINDDCIHPENITTTTINCCNVLEPVKVEVTQMFHGIFNNNTTRRLQQQQEENDDINQNCNNNDVKKENAIIIFDSNNGENTATTTCDALEPEKTEVAHIFQEICKNLTRSKVQLNDDSNNNERCSSNDEREENNAVTIIRGNNELMIDGDCIYPGNTTTASTTIGCCNVLEPVKSGVTHMFHVFLKDNATRRRLQQQDNDNDINNIEMTTDDYNNFCIHHHEENTTATTTL